MGLNLHRSSVLCAIAEQVTLGGDFAIVLPEGTLRRMLSSYVPLLDLLLRKVDRQRRGGVLALRVPVEKLLPEI